jgi:hypothetical protein
VLPALTLLAATGLIAHQRHTSDRQSHTPPANSGAGAALKRPA